MMLRKERKIPHSVFKPHAEEVVLLLNTHYSPSELPRVIFSYPKYCLRNDSAQSFLSTDNRLLAIESSANGSKFVQVFRCS